MRKITTLVSIGALVLTACSGPQGNDGTQTQGDNAAPVVHAASLERFDACPELLTYLREEGKKRVGPYGLQGMSGGPMLMEDRAIAGAAESADASGMTAAAPAQKDADSSTFSTTNVQERDVDEPDSVTTNGRYIFTTRADGNGRMRLVAIAIDDGRPKQGGTITLPEGVGTDLLIDGDRAVVLGGANYAIPFRGGAIADVDMLYPAGPQQTVVSVVDISEPGEMRITETVKLEGSYNSARMVDGVVRLVLSTMSSERLDFEQPVEPTAAAAREALAHNQRVARTAEISDWLPRFEVEDANGETKDEGPLVACDSTFAPQTFSGFQTTSVVTLDPDEPKPEESAAVMGGAGIVYASTSNLYVATQRWPEPVPVDLGRPDVAPVFKPDPAKTSLHRFDIRDATKAVYAASGEVRGTVLNQWAMSEHDGHLRVATTEDIFDAQGPGSSSSFVTVLDATEPKLEQRGRVGDIGPGERIYGVRFIGDLGYVVTFKQIDPLHVVDLADPASPKVVGELKIPGYSAYLHPVGEDRLLGVGQDVDPETTQPLGTQLSLFDISDPTAPERIDDVRVDGSTTPVEHDHHAFTWWEPSGLAVVPVSRYEEIPPVARPDGTEIAAVPTGLHAAIGYRVAGSEISEVGRASHLRHANAQTGAPEIERSFVIGDQLFTVSFAGVMSSELDSFDERGWLAFDA